MDTRENREIVRSWKGRIRVLCVILAALALPVSAQIPPDRAEWQSRVAGAFTVTSGDLATASRIAVLATDAITAEKQSAASYGAVLTLPVNIKNVNAEVESSRVSAALNVLRLDGVEIDVWTGGLAGLVVRKALENLTNPSAVRCVVLVDVPNRGVSPSGWPDWSARDAHDAPPPWAVSGSKFLRELNAKTATQEAAFRLINVWRRGPQFTPRATVMQLPRAAIDLVVDAPAGPLLPLLNSPVAAARQLPAGGPTPRKAASAASQDVDEARTYAPRPAPGNAPLLAQLLNRQFNLPPESVTAWIQYRMPTASQATERLARITDVLGARWLPDRRSLIIVGYEDYFREPLRTDILTAAIAAYRKQQPAISIDPRRPGDPPNQAPVRYESGIAGTRLGGLMFEADRVMKALSLGKDNISEADIGSEVAEFEPIARLGTEQYGSAGAVWRLWFEPERWHSFEADRYSTTLDARFRINWQKMSEGYAPSQQVVRFVDSLNRDFAQYAQEQPALAQLDGAARLIALANWLVEAKLDLKAPGQQTRMETPDHTPLIEVSATGDFGRYKVVQVIQGGAVAGIKLRHIREPSPPVDALLRKALAEIYPPALANPPPVSTRGPQIARRPIPSVAPRPPPATAGFVVDDILYQAAVFSALPLNSAPGITSASDKATDSPTTVDDIIRERALAPQILTTSVDDAEDSPVLVLSGSRFGKDSGQVVFNDEPLRIIAWTDRLVAVAAPSVLRSGRILLRTSSGESNPIQLDVVAGFARAAPPPVTFENATDFAITVLAQPQLFGSYRTFTLQPGGRLTTKVVPGAYKILGFPADQNVVVSQHDSTKQFNSGYEYSIRFEPRDFPVSKITIRNNTGGTLSFNLQGPISRSLTILPGATTLQVTPGSYQLDVGSACGRATRNLEVGRGAIDELTYQCAPR